MYYIRTTLVEGSSLTYSSLIYLVYLLVLELVLSAGLASLIDT